jgi:hypothetical protein
MRGATGELLEFILEHALSTEKLDKLVLEV